MSRLDEYLAYHHASMELGDVDPANGALRYVAERFELNREQRYWLAFLYAVTYCVPTTFWLYNEFPDFENVDLGRLERWWSENRPRVVFQSDRRWIRSRNLFVPVVRSYSDLVFPGTQAAFYEPWVKGAPTDAYDCVFELAGRISQFGRYALFLYTEALHVVVGLAIEPPGLDLRHAESSRNGLCYALDLDGLLSGEQYGRKRLTHDELDELGRRFDALMRAVRAGDRGYRSTVWSVETTLCAYKKHHRGKRYVGYYLDRQAEEIAKLQDAVPEGVCWDVLWDYRNETHPRATLRHARDRGVR